MGDLTSKLHEEGITVKHGLLYKEGEMLSAVEGDVVARVFGFVYAEQLVHAVQDERNNKSR
jgi:hypothetical protein